VVQLIAHRNHGSAQDRAEAAAAYLGVDVAKESFVHQLSGEYIAVLLKQGFELFPVLLQGAPLVDDAINEWLVLRSKDFFLRPEASERDGRHRQQVRVPEAAFTATDLVKQEQYKSELVTAELLALVEQLRVLCYDFAQYRVGARFTDGEDALPRHGQESFAILDILIGSDSWARLFKVHREASLWHDDADLAAPLVEVLEGVN